MRLKGGTLDLCKEETVESSKLVVGDEIGQRLQSLLPPKDEKAKIARFGRVCFLV